MSRHFILTYQQLHHRLTHLILVHIQYVLAHCSSGRCTATLSGDHVSLSELVCRTGAALTLALLPTPTRRLFAHSEVFLPHSVSLL